MELANVQEESNSDNILFLVYKKQLISLGFRHKEAKILLKYIIKYYDNIILNNSINFADIYYFYDYFFLYEFNDPFSKLVYTILNKWVNNNHHDEYSYLYSKFTSFGEYVPWSNIFVDLERVDISKILSLYYHKKQNEQNDVLVIKEIINKNPNMFSNNSHAVCFFERIEIFFRTRINWKIFVTAVDSNNILPKELIDNIYNYLDIKIDN